MQVSHEKRFTLQELDIDQFNALQYGLKLLIERNSGSSKDQLKRQVLWEAMVKAY